MGKKRWYQEHFYTLCVCYYASSKIIKNVYRQVNFDLVLFPSLFTFIFHFFKFSGLICLQSVQFPVCTAAGGADMTQEFQHYGPSTPLIPWPSITFNPFVALIPNNVLMLPSSLSHLILSQWGQGGTGTAVASKMSLRIPVKPQIQHTLTYYFKTTHQLPPVHFLLPLSSFSLLPFTFLLSLLSEVFSFEWQVPTGYQENCWDFKDYAINLAHQAEEGMKALWAV